MTLAQPYPNELWYSYLARIAQQRVYANWRLFCCDVLGKYICSPRLVLPQCLDHFVSVTCDTKDYEITTVRYKFFREHSLVGLVSSFLCAAQRERLEQWCRVEQYNYQRFSSTHFFLRPKTLRHCLQCITSDRKSHGEAYWHTEHQIATISRCPQHATPLKEIVLPPLINTRTYLSLEHALVNWKQPKTTVKVPDSEFLEKLNALSQKVFKHPIDVTEPKAFNEAHRDLFEYSQLIKPSGSFDYIAADELLRSQPGFEYLQKKVSTLATLRPSSRASQILEENYRVPYALMLPLYASLPLSSHDVFEIVSNHRQRSFCLLTSKPFTPAPPPCISPLCQSKRTVLQDTEHRGKVTAYVFRCTNCGELFSQTFKEGKYHRTLVRGMSERWEEIIIETVRKGKPLKTIIHKDYKRKGLVIKDIIQLGYQKKLNTDHILKCLSNPQIISGIKSFFNENLGIHQASTFKEFIIGSEALMELLSSACDTGDANEIVEKLTGPIIRKDKAMAEAIRSHSTDLINHAPSLPKVNTGKLMKRGLIPSCYQIDTRFRIHYPLTVRAVTKYLRSGIEWRLKQIENFQEAYERTGEKQYYDDVRTRLGFTCRATMYQFFEKYGLSRDFLERRRSACQFYSSTLIR
jgi:hypothetical protein